MYSTKNAKGSGKFDENGPEGSFTGVLFSTPMTSKLERMKKLLYRPDVWTKPGYSTENKGDWMKVGAILNANHETKKIYLIGFGTMHPKEVPVPDPIRQECNIYYDQAVQNGLEVPKIVLEGDGEKVVYGCECWWGPEDVVNDILEESIKSGYELIPVEMDKYYQDIHKSMNIGSTGEASGARTN